MIPDFYHLWFHQGLYCHWDWGVFQNHRKKDDVCQQCTNTSRSPVSIHYFWFWARFLGESNHIATFLLKLIMSDFGDLVANVELLTTYILAGERSPAPTYSSLKRKPTNPRCTIPIVHIPTWVLLGEKIHQISTIQITMRGQTEHWWLFTLDSSNSQMNSLLNVTWRAGGWLRNSSQKSSWKTKRKNILWVSNRHIYIYQYTSKKYVHIIYLSLVLAICNFIL